MKQQKTIGDLVKLRMIAEVANIFGKTSITYQKFVYVCVSSSYQYALKYYSNLMRRVNK